MEYWKHSLQFKKWFADVKKNFHVVKKVTWLEKNCSHFNKYMDV